MSVAKPASNLAPEPVTTYAVTVQWLEGGTVYEDGSFDEDCYMATSDDIAGLVLQADSLDEMEEEMRVVIPILLEGNHGVDAGEAGKISIRMLDKADPRGVTKYVVAHSV